MAVSSYLSPIGLILQAFTDQGVVLSGGLIYVYAAGTTTPTPTYTDSTLSVANTNPIVLSATGRLPASVWLPAGITHKMVLQTSTGATVTGGTVDNLTSINDPTNTYVNTFTVTSFPSTSSIALNRNANYTGGTVGYVNSLVYLVDTAQPGITSNEWTLTSVMNNYCTNVNGAQNVGGYLQGNKYSTGPTWGGTVEVREMVATNNPVAGTVGLEVDVRSNGTDTGGARVGIDVVCTRFNTSGAATTTSYGVRVQNNNDTTNSLISNAFSAYQCNVAVAFDCAYATVSSGSLRMASNVPILFDTVGVNQLYYDGTALRYDTLVSSTRTQIWKVTPGTRAEFSNVVQSASTVAPSSGGSVTCGVSFSSTSNLGLYTGTGAPTITAAQGSLYVNTTAASTTTRLYINTTGSNVWTPFTSAA